MFQHCFLFLLCFSLLPLVGSAQSRKAKNLKKDYLESSFLVVNNNTSPVIKWEDKNTIAYAIKGELQYMSRKNWDRFVTDLEALTGLTIVETNQTENANIAIYFSELKDFAATEKIKLPAVDISHFDHWNSRNYNTQFQMQRTALCIVPSQISSRERGSYQVQRLFVKALGLLGEVENEYSIFHKHQTRGNRYLSKDDKRIIKIHYLPGVKAGMTIEAMENLLGSTVDLEKLLKQKI